MTKPSTREWLKVALSRIDDPNGEGARGTLRLFRDQAMLTWRQATVAA